MVRTSSTAICVLGLGCMLTTVLWHRMSLQWANAGSAVGRMSNQHVVVQYGGYLQKPLLQPQEEEPQQPPQAQAQVQPQQQPQATDATLVARSPPTSPPPPPPPELSLPPPPLAKELPAWLEPEGTALAFNTHAKAALRSIRPRGTTLHFTFGSSVMMDFVKNWLFFVNKAGLRPFLVGAADVPLLKGCNELGVPAAGIIPELDVWTYHRKPKAAAKELYEMTAEWKYFRHHNSDFLEMGLVKVRWA